MELEAPPCWRTEEGRAKQAEVKMLEVQEERRTLLAEKAALLGEVAGLKEDGAGGTTMLEDLGSGMEVVELKEKLEKLEGELKGERGLLVEQHAKTEEAKERASKLQCQLDELRGATSVDDSVLMEDEVANLKDEVETVKKEKAELKVMLDKAEKQVNQLEKYKKKLENDEFEQHEKLVELESEKEEQSKLVEQLQAKMKEETDVNVQLKATVEELELKLKSTSVNEQIQLTKLKQDLEDSTKTKTQLEKDLKETASLLAAAVEKRHQLEADLEVERKSKASAIAQQEVKLQRTTSTSNTKLVEVEVRADSLEKELSTKDLYVKELEDIIVEKESRIIELEEGSKSKELEASKKDVEELKTVRQKLVDEKKAKEEVETELSNTQAELLKVDTTRQRLEIQVEEVKGKLAHQEEVRRQREDLERRTNELMVTSYRLEGLEQELEANKDTLKKLEEQLAGESEKTKSAEEKLAAEVLKNSKLKSELIDAKDEVKMNKVATKKNAKDALEVESLKEKAAELEKEVVRLKSLAEAHEREVAALMKRNELLASEASANSYELEKTKQERSNLMAHYENKFRGLQNDLDKERSRKTEVGKLQEVMARATPTKATNELRERLRREEEKVSELRAELGILQKQADERSALHERELKRAKQASERTADMYREQNVVLQRQWREESVRTGASSNEVSTLEADDSRTGDDSIVGGTPVVVKKTRGRGRGKATKLGNRTTSNASLASYEDTENEGEVGGRSRANTGIARKGRVTRRSKLDFNHLEEEQVEKEAEKKPARKRGGASSTEALKERQVSALSPVVEGLNKSTRLPTSSSSNIFAQFRDSDSASFLTPAVKKKRKLYSTTPQTNAVFTPPTPTSDSKADTPGSIVKRQLRSRKPLKMSWSR